MTLFCQHWSYASVRRVWMQDLPDETSVLFPVSTVLSLYSLCAPYGAVICPQLQKVYTSAVALDLIPPTAVGFSSHKPCSKTAKSGLSYLYSSAVSCSIVTVIV